MDLLAENPSFFTKKHTDTENQIIPCFDKYNFKEGQTFRFRITQIYDPSKFWIVIKFKDLEVFQKHLFRWYYLNRSTSKIPEDKIEKDMYCVIFTDGGYYRGTVKTFTTDVQPKQEYQIYLIDYGILKVVEANNIYYMTEKYAQVPQFAVRSALAGICPKKHHRWTTEDVNAFQSLVTDKILIGVVVNIDDTRRIIEIHFKEEDSSVMIHEILREQNLARFFDEEPEISDSEPPPPENIKYAYLFPSHETIESGKVPSNINDAEYQALIAPRSSIVQRYYSNENSS